MQDRALFAVSALILVLSCGLCLGLTFLPCYSAICVEEFFSYNVRLHIAAYYAVLSFTFLVLILRRLSPVVRRILDTCLVSRPIPFTPTRVTIGGVAISAAVALLLGGAVGYFADDEVLFYKSRADQVGDRSNGYMRLAAVGITGHTIDILTGLIILPVSRTSVLSRVLHLSPSALLTFHQLVGYLYFILVILHTTFFYSWVPLFARATEDSPQKNQFAIDNPTVSQDVAEAKGPWTMSVLASGVIAFFIFVAIIVTSLPSARRKSYNIFYITHAFSLLFFFCVCVHASTDFYMLLPGLLLWLLDWSIRIRGLSRDVPATMQGQGNGWYRITIPREYLSESTKRAIGRSAVFPLQSWYLNVPAVSKWQVHPFTPARVVASSKHNGEESLVFLWRTSDMQRKEKQQSKEWTTKLAALLPMEQPSNEDPDIAPVTRVHGPTKALKLRLEGPYPLSHQPFEAHEHVVCIVGGTGITGALSLTESFLILRGNAGTEENNGHRTCITSKVTIIWTLKEAEDTDLDDVKDLTLRARSIDARVVFRKHLTGEGRARLDLDQTVKDVLQGASDEKDSSSAAHSTWIYWSGPAALMASGETACIKARSRARSTVAESRLEWYCARWDV